MKKTVSCILTVMLLLNINCISIKADNDAVPKELSGLYGLSALLMDADTGEVLYEKNSEEPMAIASTTKILTCMLAIELGNPRDIVTISANAASQPDVQMNASEGEQYYLEDLLKGMMLESYNDISVAIAEHIAGTTEAFAEKMNQKAREIGCSNSYFITPNGLDAVCDGNSNCSTARDLALILSYAIKNDDFLSITQTESWEIKELQGTGSAVASNRNRFLYEYDGLISGKTGFTGKAGYCYAGAATRDGRTFVAVTLGAGWPPHKGYKWSDIRKLFDYGFEHYQKKEVDFQGVRIPDRIPVTDGINKDGQPIEEIKIKVPKTETLLLKDDETYYAKVYIKKEVTAPVRQGDVVGYVELYKNGESIKKLDIVSIDDVEKNNIWMKLYNILRYFFVKIRENLLKLLTRHGIIN